MQINKRVIQFTKEQAQFGFGALAQQILQDVEQRVVQLQTEAAYGSEQFALVNRRPVYPESRQSLRHACRKPLS